MGSVIQGLSYCPSNICLANRELSWPGIRKFGQLNVEGQNVEGQVLQSHIHSRPLGVRCEGVGLLCYLTVCIRPVP